MQIHGTTVSSHALDRHGIQRARNVYWNLGTPALYEQAIRREEGKVVQSGPLATLTGKHTGRSPNDKFIVREAQTADDIWWGSVNRPFSQEKFNELHRRMLDYIAERDIFVFDGYAGADPDYRLSVRIINEYAWHNLFARNMFIVETDPSKLRAHVPGFTVIDMPGFRADPARDGTNSPTLILVDFSQRLVLIGGTEYAGEIKKSIFTALNYMLPQQGVMAMHCSANYGEEKEDVALFFGLSGTGKTTLSNDPARTLIGDDEHGWSDRGVFNFEGGCYAKVINLDAAGEPQIYATTQRFGTILENVVFDDASRCLDLGDARHTENTRASYPLTQLENVDLSGVAGHPRTIIFLTADAFGVLPPISKLTKAQAMYHFLSGYTAKVAGTERGVTEPKATFSACFGAPFMPLHPAVYADLLGEKIERHGVTVWLVNTGWSGGPYGVGRRIKLAHTRAMVTAALAGKLDSAATIQEPTFGLQIPTAIDSVPTSLLNPRNTWQDKQAYDRQAARLIDMFIANFKQFEEDVSSDVVAAGPQPAPVAAA